MESLLHGQEGIRIEPNRDVAVLRIVDFERFHRLVFNDVGALPLKLQTRFPEAFAQNVEDILKSGVAKLLDALDGKRLRSAISHVVRLQRGEDDGVFLLLAKDLALHFAKRA